MAEISPLRRRMIEDMTVRNLSPATQQSYLSAVSKLSRYFGRSPDRLDLEDVHAFQVHLVATGISWPALNQIVCALRFFFGVTLGQAIVPERIAHAREPSKLPVVLSADEVVRFLEAIPSLKSRTALTTVYAAGLRVSEVVLLKIADIDSQRMVIRVEQGKGGKDRYVMLSPQLLTILRTYWRLTRPKRWLFPGRDDERPLVPNVLHAACRSACAAAGLSKPVTVHTFVIEGKRLCWPGCDPAGYLGFCRARSAIDRAAEVVSAARAKIHGPSARGWIASISPASAASRNDLGAIRSFAALLRLSHGSIPPSAGLNTGMR